MKRSWRWPIAGFVVGSLVGATLLTVNIVGAFVGGPAPGVPPPVESGIGEILHTPPVLVPLGEPVELAYEVVCNLRSDARERPCSPKGSVHVRTTGDHAFAEVPLSMDRNGRLSATIAGRYVRGAGFDYYAAIDDSRGSSASLPAGGHDVPHHAWTVSGPTTVELAARWLHARAPDAFVARAGWGAGNRQAGVNRGREQARIGPSAFDVAPDGSVVLLDQANQRLAVYRRGADAPQQIPISFAGGEGDLAVGDDGTIYVLDDGGPASPTPLVRSFDASGRPMAGALLAEPVADMVRIGPGGPLVHSYPSEMWLPTGPGKPPFSAAKQVELARAGRTVAGGLEIVVHASPARARFALVRGERVVRSWLVKSPSRLGEVQLVEPYGDGLLVVVRLWNEIRAQFRVLRLAPGGLAGDFAIDRSEWAETAPLSRFRLRGTTLYQLRSGPSGIAIAAFEIGGPK